MELVNRVVQSGIKVYNLESLWTGCEVREFDLAPFLEEGILLKEKSFRAQMATQDWSQFKKDIHVAVFCSTEALIPMWAYMLVTSYLACSRSVTIGREKDVIQEQFTLALEREDWSKFSDSIVVVKGCASGIVPKHAYARAMSELQKVARKVMFGEPCSSVPVWRRAVERRSMSEKKGSLVSDQKKPRK